MNASVMPQYHVVGTKPLGFVDSAVAARLEAAEDIASMLFAQKLSELRPELGCAVLEVAGGHAVFAGAGSPLTHVIGMGLSGPVGSEELERVEEFYFSRGSAFELVLAPLAHESLFKLIGSRPYRLASMESVLCRRIEAGEVLPAPTTDIKIVRPSAAEMEQFDDVVARGFASGGDPTPLRGIFSTFAQLQSSIAVMAYLDGELAAGAGGLIVKEHNMTALFGASTLPEFRHRGLQSALLRARLKLAADAGCELAVVVASPGSTSQRNAERTGFRLVYTKAILVRDFPKNES